MIFKDINLLEFFSINDEFGTADFLKTSEHDALCMSSSDATYERCRQYYFKYDEIVTKY